ncbi:MAG: DUF4965 domain-containing protein, partial [Fimbriimonadales bacterium]|nr:DUF4965 domain-containing protein [Fimbriimonadales bacterium]
MSSGACFRPPAVPLVTHDPYFSVWSFADAPTDDHTKHWTGATMALAVLARVDGKPYRLVGREPAGVEPARMLGLSVRATTTTYVLQAGAVELRLEFLSPLLMDDPELLAFPASYLTVAARSSDGARHRVRLYADATGEWCVDRPQQPVEWARYLVDGQPVLALASSEQRPLARKGDDLRIDWGRLLLTSPDAERGAFGAASLLRGLFADQGALPASDDLRMPRPAHDEWPVAALALRPMDVGGETVERRLTIAYDDVLSIEFLGRRLPPLWRERSQDLAEFVRQAEARYADVRRRCSSFDAELRRRLEEVGGPKYAQIAELAYRQSIAGHKLVRDVDGRLLMFSKENFSNGCIATVDVTYPGAPLYLALNPDLLEAQIRPVLAYASSPRWRFPFAPHDLGTYPLANGQVYGGGERSEENQMPVEESGNLLILAAALAERKNDPALAREFWPVLTRWADYLLEKGLDPENQLCTDDFAGHLAHNANLSIKAILGIACHARLCERLGLRDEARRRMDAARAMAREWVRLADDGDHYRLAFDKPGTWSQKYNLVWDRLFGFGLFPDDVSRKELAWYLGRQGTYGLPLDSRARYTKA